MTWEFKINISPLVVISWRKFYLSLKSVQFLDFLYNLLKPFPQAKSMSRSTTYIQSPRSKYHYANGIFCCMVLKHLNPGSILRQRKAAKLWSLVLNQMVFCYYDWSISVTQSQHYWHFGPENSLLWRAVLFSNIPGLYQLDASGSQNHLPPFSSQLSQPMSTDIVKCFLDSKITLDWDPLLEIVKNNIKCITFS